MRTSIKKQITVAFLAIMMNTLFVCWFVNNMFLEKYYVSNKENVLLNVYSLINEAANKGEFNSKEFAVDFQRICSTGNIAMLIIDASGSVKASSVNDISVLSKQLYGNIYEKNESNISLLQQTDMYVIQKTHDSLLKADYIDMWGSLENGNLFIMRTALESIRESVDLSNRFLGYVAFCAVIISGFMICFISEQISKPILRLANISKRMSNLDFDAKYEVNGNNEIAVLGEAMNQLSETLEKTISELKTANNELKKDIEKKEQIDEMRKDFLSNVSHELKTPIALVQGYSEGLKECINDDPESREFYCDVIIDEANKMNRMVQKLLTLNQLEFGNDVVSMERFDIVSMIRNILQSSDILIKQKEATVKFVYTDPIYVWADEFKIEEVFTNYLTNALNHLDYEKIIDIKVQSVEDGIVRISVFNTGNTIPEADIDNIWDKFYKVDKARTREYGGSGVGLSIVKAIMNSLNQRCGVNNYSNGVEFWFELEANQIEKSE